MKDKNPLWQIVVLLIISFIALGFYSFKNKAFNVFGEEIRQSDIKQICEPQTDALAYRIQYPKTILGNPNKREAIDTTKQRILFFGDSMLEGLMWRAKAYATANGHKFFPVVWYSSSTKWYGESDTITYYIHKFKPTYVIMVLGANELFIRDIFKKRNKDVKNIIKQFDTLRYVWIGPPNWKDDTGINDMVMANMPANQYFDSRQLTYQRAKDGAHPTRRSANRWMDSIASWIMNTSRYPILLNEPKSNAKTHPHPTLLQPMY